MKKLESKWTYAVLLLPMILCVFIVNYVMLTP